MRGSVVALERLCYNRFTRLRRTPTRGSLH